MRLAVFLILVVFSLQARPLEVSVSAPSAILINAETGVVLFEKAAHVRAYPASTTKVATLLYILDQKRPSLSEMVTVSAESQKMKDPKRMGEAPAYWLEIDGTRMGLLRGEVVSVEALLHGLMMVSANDAANVLAEFCSGSVAAFVEEMNGYLRELGCKETHFGNPHGLHHAEHYTTAYDLSVMARRALGIPKFREIVAKVSYVKPKTNRQPGGEIRQANPLVKPGRHYYPKAIGMKTGFHSMAKNTLVAAAEHEGRTLVAVLLGCEKRDTRYTEATRLFEAAFAEQREKRRLLGPENVFTQDIPGAKLPLHAALTKELAIEFFPRKSPNVKRLYIGIFLRCRFEKGRRWERRG